MTVVEVAKLERVPVSMVYKWIRCAYLAAEKKSIVEGGRLGVWIDPENYDRFVQSKRAGRPAQLIAIDPAPITAKSDPPKVQAPIVRAENGPPVKVPAVPEVPAPSAEAVSTEPMVRPVRYLTAEQVAERYGLTVEWVYGCRSLPRRKIGKYLTFREDELVAMEERSFRGYKPQPVQLHPQSQAPVRIEGPNRSCWDQRCPSGVK